MMIRLLQLLLEYFGKGVTSLLWITHTHTRMPKKPVKRGFKIWMRADATNGYISEFYVYTGKEGGNTEVKLGAKVVMSLTKKLTGLYHHVYFDNYFTSISLLINLLKIGIYSCGTMQTEKGAQMT